MVSVRGCRDPLGSSGDCSARRPNDPDLCRIVVVVLRNPTLEFVGVVAPDLTAWRVRMERLSDLRGACL